MLDSPPLHSIDKLSPPSSVSAQLVGLFAELVQGCTYLNNQVRSDIDELKARLSSLDESRNTSSNASESDKIEHATPVVEGLKLTPLLGASRQFYRAIVRNDVELVRKYVDPFVTLNLR